MTDDMALRALCLCDGYGGFELGLRLADVPVRTVCRVERDSYAAATLVARMEEAHLDQAPIWDDLCTFGGSAWRGRVDLITAGFPCQPFSAAGEQRGVDDERWIWPDIARIIADVGPRYVFLENVTGLVRLGLPHVLADLAALGFDAEWGVLSAADVGAPHRRERIWILADAERSGRVAGIRDTDARRGQPDVAGFGTQMADANGTRRKGLGWSAERGGPQHDEPRRDGFPPPPDDANGWAEYIADGGPEPAVRRGADGRPAWLADALHLGGNGLIPLAAGHAFRQLHQRLAGR